jgi:hypothetical protein
MGESDFASLPIFFFFVSHKSPRDRFEQIWGRFARFFASRNLQRSSSWGLVNTRCRRCTKIEAAPGRSGLLQSRWNYLLKWWKERSERASPRSIAIVPLGILATDPTCQCPSSTLLNHTTVGIIRPCLESLAQTRFLGAIMKRLRWPSWARGPKMLLCGNRWGDQNLFTYHECLGLFRYTCSMARGLSVYIVGFGTWGVRWMLVFVNFRLDWRSTYDAPPYQIY